MNEHKRTPYSILMSPAERLRAQELAALIHVSVPELIRLSVSGKDLEKTLRAIQKKTADRKEAAQILSLLGQSRIASNLNQIAHAINTGTLVLSPDVTAQLLDACETLQWIRTKLIAIQGLKPQRPSS